VKEYELLEKDNPIQRQNEARRIQKEVALRASQANSNYTDNVLREMYGRNRLNNNIDTDERIAKRMQDTFGITTNELAMENMLRNYMSFTGRGAGETHYTNGGDPVYQAEHNEVEPEYDIEYADIENNYWIQNDRLASSRVIIVEDTPMRIQPDDESQLIGTLTASTTEINVIQVIFGQQSIRWYKIENPNQEGQFVWIPAFAPENPYVTNTPKLVSEVRNTDTMIVANGNPALQSNWGWVWSGDSPGRENDDNFFIHNVDTFNNVTAGVNLGGLVECDGGSSIRGLRDGTIVTVHRQDDLSIQTFRTERGEEWIWISL